MTDNTYTSFEPPDGTLIVTAATLDYSYHLTTTDDDLICVVIGDPQLGSIALTLAEEQAREIATHLTRMVIQIDDLRARRTQERNNEGETP